MIDGRAFANSALSFVTIHESNCHFDVSGSFLTDFEGISIIRYFGHDLCPEIPRQIEILCQECFYQCISASSFTFESGSSLTRIEAGAFAVCSPLKSICIPASVEILSKSCFSSCESLSSVTFQPESKLTQIREEVFRNCLSLKSLCLPRSLQSIAGSALERSGISSITVEEGNCHLRVSGSFLTDFEGLSVIAFCSQDRGVVIPRDFEILRPCSFISRQVFSLKFESGSKLKRIEESAFAYCPFLTSISIPSSVEILCVTCFTTLGRLTSLTFEPGSRLTRIQPAVFSGCAYLRSVCIPSSVEALGVQAFCRCRSLSSVTFERGSKCTRFEAGAFDDCRELKSICIPSSVEVLGDDCFSSCEALSPLTFESGSKLTRIEARAFRCCSSLKSFSIPASLQSVDGSALTAYELSRITVEEGNSHFAVSGSFLTDFEGISVIRYFGSDECAEIGNDIEILCENSFCECESVSSLKFSPSGKLHRIEGKVFRCCSSLESICIPASVQKIDGSALANPELRMITVEEGSCHFRVSGSFLTDFEGITVIRYFGSGKGVTIPQHIEVLGKGSFAYHEQLEFIVFEPGSNLSRIEAKAFDCWTSPGSICLPASLQVVSASSLTGILKIRIEDGHRHLALSNSFLTDLKGVTALRYCGGDRSIVIPQNIDILGEHCFDAYPPPSRLTFESGSKLTQIETKAFRGCNGLKSLCIPSSVEVFGKKCFAKCRSLRSLQFESGSQLIRIEAGAFSGCWALLSVLIPQSIRVLSKNWALGSALVTLVFESGASLRTLMKNDDADLKSFWDIEIITCDCDLNFDGYAVDHRRPLHGSVRLVKAARP
jgi:hypothetical protein